jgi:ParB family chromosome partitioning protein
MSHPVAVEVPSSIAPASAPVMVDPSPAAAPPPAPATIETPAAPTDGLRQIPVEAIQPNPHQPRQRFNESGLQSLAQSIREQGLMQPIIVRPPRKEGVGTGDRSQNGGYELVAGERRWRAAKLAGLTTIPALVRELDEQQLAEWALVENLQREDLNPIERAEAFKHLVERFGLSHEEVASRVGIDRPTVSNLLRLLSLEENTRSLVRDGILSMGQARALAGLSDPLAQNALAQRAVAQGWSVRRVEEAVRKINESNTLTLPDPGEASVKARPGPSRGHLLDLEEQISRQLGGKVRIRPGRRKGSGTLTLAFRDLDHFDAILQRLGVQAE